MVFIGGGNMASAIISGLMAGGSTPSAIKVLEPSAAQREVLASRFDLEARETAGSWLSSADIVVWAVKPQFFGAAARPCKSFIGNALQLSIMAGVHSRAIALASGSERVVRAMPNTPALIGEGVAGMFASAAVTSTDRVEVEKVMASTGGLVWVETEDGIDAVTAVSGSGPAYVFLLMEAMLSGAGRMGLTDAQARQLVVQTVVGAASLVRGSTESPETLRRRVTSPGGTTEAAVAVLEAGGFSDCLVDAILAARDRARALSQSN